MNSQPNKRTIIIIVSAIDTILGGTVLLIFFGFLPVDIPSWGIPSWVIGLVGGIWFLSALAILVYQVTRTDFPE
jgi:integral membrane sensor domain MASE1